MTPSQAWQIVLPILQSHTIECWGEQDYEDEPAFVQIAADIEAGNITPDVLSEIENKMTFDDCVGRYKTACLTVLAANGRLEKFDPNATYWPRRPKTMVLLGERWVI